MRKSMFILVYQCVKYQYWLKRLWLLIWSKLSKLKELMRKTFNIVLQLKIGSKCMYNYGIMKYVIG